MDDKAQHRVFHEEDAELPAGSSASGSVGSSSSDAALTSMRAGIVGRLAQFTSPFGVRPIVYTDWTASGRAHAAVESYVTREVLPFYANTHTTTSVTGAQSTCFRHEARQMIAEAVNAKVTGKAAEDVVLFVGTGATAAANKLVHLLGLHLPPPPPVSDSSDGGSASSSSSQRRPVVIVGPMEHHSNLLPWRESYAEVVCVGAGLDGRVDFGDLEKCLQAAQGAPLICGSFSAASNVTGVVERVDDITVLLHAYGALSFWDYATLASYHAVDMNPTTVGTEHHGASLRKDAVFFSPHKLVGGANTPGVLVVKKRLLANAVPATQVGGGTVFYVTDDSHRYLSNLEEREEGGTPDLVGSVRAALALRLKRLCGGPEMVRRVHGEYLALARARLASAAPQLVLLDHRRTASMGDAQHQLPIFSFLVRWAPPPIGKSASANQGGRFLHFNFVCALLNDLFGIQCRGGCQCAGPYAQRLLGLGPINNAAVEQSLLQDKAEVLRPGFSRLSLPYTLSLAEVEFTVAALSFVAQNGYLFLPQYVLNAKTGECKHRSRATKTLPDRKWLSHFSLNDLKPLTAPADGQSSGDAGNGWSNLEEEDLATRFQKLLADAEALAVTTAKELGSGNKGINKGSGADMLPGSSENMRWFVYPSEVETALKSSSVTTFASSNDSNVDSAYSWAPLGPVQPPSMGTLVGSTPQEIGDAAASLSMETSQASIMTYGEKPGYLKYPARSSDAPPAPALWHDSKKVSALLPPTGGTGAAVVNLSAEPVADASAGANAGSRSKTTFHGVMLPEPKKPRLETREVNQASLQEVPLVASLLPSSEAATENSSSNSTNISSDASTGPPTGGKAKAKLPVPPKKLMRLVGQAIRDWRMIEEGDRLVVGLSGGKDSLTLLFALLDLQRRAPIKFTVAAATVDPMTPSFDPSPLVSYLQHLGIPYHYLKNPIIDRAADGQLQGDSLCAFCSRMKRGLLYGCCRDNKYNKLVLGQHLDDLAESFIMSTLHNGQVRTMKAHYQIEAGDVAVIRPLIYVREGMTKEFATLAGLPIINENCPACFEEPKERHRVKQLLAREEALSPTIFANLRSALLPLMGEGVYPYMNLVRAQVEANGTDPQQRQRKKKPPPASPAAALPESTTLSTDGGNDEKAGAADPEGDETSSTPGLEVSGSYKWGSACLTVLPDAWLMEEVARRARTASEKDQKGAQMDLNGEAKVPSDAKPAPLIQMPNASKVMLCNTGKCEMFD